MITLGPIKDKAFITELFFENRLEINENSGCVTAKSGQQMLGYCLYDLDKSQICIRLITPLNDIPLADGILRSTLHVAAERSIMNAFYADTVPEDFLEKIGFIKDKNNKTLQIDKLFKSCCSCG